MKLLQFLTLLTTINSCSTINSFTTNDVENIKLGFQQTQSDLKQTQFKIKVDYCRRIYKNGKQEASLIPDSTMYNWGVSEKLIKP